MLLVKEYPYAIKFISIETVDVQTSFVKTGVRTGSYEIVYVIKGGLVITGERETHKLSPGDVFILFPNTAAKFASPDDSGVTYYALNIIILAPDKIGFDVKTVHSKQNIRLLELFKYLKYMAENPAYTDNMCRSCISLILSEISVNQLSENSNHRWALLMNEVRHWLKMNIIETAGPLENVAGHFGYSKSHISRMFKKTFGQSIHEYIDELKIGLAVNLLLNTKRTVRQISENLGYPSVDAFIKFFKYHRSCTPGIFRKNMRKDGVGEK